MLLSLRFTLQSIFKIRAAQTWRMLKGIGIFRLLVVMCLIAVSLCALFIYTFEQTSAIVIVLSFGAVLALIQINRPDKKFTATQLSHSQLFTTAEYFLLSVPLMACLIYHHHFLLMIATLLIDSLIPYLNLSIKTITINTRLQRLIPNNSYEWKAGVRKAFVPLCGIGLLAMSTAWFIASAPIAILLITIIVCSFYEVCEPESFLYFQQKSASQLLWRKMKTGVGLFLIATIPLVMAFIIFDHELWYIPVIEVVIFCILIIYNIVTKYAFYNPNHKPTGTTLFNGIGYFGTLFPILFPLILALAIWFYYKSIQRLKVILNDFN